jgi:hypothetical protein
MVREILPHATTQDIQHFMVMIDTDANGYISQQEFTAALADTSALHSKVRAGGDPELLLTLHDYLTDNELILQEYFRSADIDRNGEVEVDAEGKGRRKGRGKAGQPAFSS